MPDSNRPLVERLPACSPARAEQQCGRDRPLGGREGRPRLARASQLADCRAARCASPTRRWPRPAIPRRGEKWSTRRSLKSDCARGCATPSAPIRRWTLAASSSLEPVLRRRFGPQRRLARDPRSYGAGAAGSAVVVNAYLLPLSALLLLGGALGDHFGRRLCWSSVHAFRDHSLICALPPASNSCSPRRARRRRALCCPTALPCSTRPIREKRGRAVGIWAAAGAAAAAMRP